MEIIHPEGGLYVITRFNEKLHIVEIWLTREDQQNEALIASLSARYREWNEKGYQPVLFRSGCHNLYEDMLALLKDWRLRQAEREVLAEKAYHPPQ